MFVGLGSCVRLFSGRVLWRIGGRGRSGIDGCGTLSVSEVEEEFLLRYRCFFVSQVFSAAAFQLVSPIIDSALSCLRFSIRICTLSEGCISEKIVCYRRIEIPELCGVRDERLESRLRESRVRNSWWCELRRRRTVQEIECRGIREYRSGCSGLWCCCQWYAW
jgi:hypothetical protein